MKYIIKASRVWDTPEYDRAMNEFLPNSGEGNTMASQCVTAINKLVYKWYNDGDVFDNTRISLGWMNDLSDYANWLFKYIPEAADILLGVYQTYTEKEYEQLLDRLVTACLDMEDLERLASHPKIGTIYDCSGPFEFNEDDGDYDDDEDDYYEDEYEDEEY